MRVELPAGLPPWLAAGLIALAVTAAAILGVVRAVMPRDSADRLAWWMARWAHLRWCRTTSPAQADTPPGPAATSSSSAAGPLHGANRAAWALIGQKIAALSDLGDRVAAQQAAAGQLDLARGSGLAPLSQMERRRLEAEAQTAVDRSGADYALGYRQALDAGWSHHQLAAIGYPSPGSQLPRT